MTPATRSQRSVRSTLQLALLGLLASGCAELQRANWMREHGDKNDRVEPVGGGVLVVRPLPVQTKRVGLVSLDTGERRVVELERFLEVHRGAFAGPDAQGRYAYFERNTALAKPAPTGLSSLLAGPSEVKEYEQSWRIKIPPTNDLLKRSWFEKEPRRLVVGELGKPGERVLVERHPADVLEKALALSPKDGALAFFAFDFDAQGVPQSLHLEVWDFAGGKPRTFPLGRPNIDTSGNFGPSLAWLADGRHLLFKHDTLNVDSGGTYELDNDWNGGKVATDSPAGFPNEPAPTLRKIDPATGFASGRSSAWLPIRRGVVLAVLDTQTGAVRDIGPGLYAWPTSDGDDVFASDGAATWFVRAATGEVHDRRELAQASPLRAPKSSSPFDSHLAVIGATSKQKLLVLANAAQDAGLPREWTQILGTQPDGAALTLVAPDGGPSTCVVPALTQGWLTLSNGALPADMPLFRRSAKHDRE